MQVLCVHRWAPKTATTASHVARKATEWLLEASKAAGKRGPVAAEGPAVTGTTQESHLDTETASCSTAKVNQVEKQTIRKNGNEPSKSTVANKEIIVRLIGRKATTKCLLNGLTVTALVDTGAQVSLIDRAWKNKYIPDVIVRLISELLE